MYIKTLLYTHTMASSPLHTSQRMAVTAGLPQNKPAATAATNTRTRLLLLLLLLSC
jgi:hypothetical protein